WMASSLRSSQRRIVRFALIFVLARGRRPAATQGSTRCFAVVSCARPPCSGSRSRLMRIAVVGEEPARLVQACDCLSPAGHLGLCLNEEWGLPTALACAVRPVMLGSIACGVAAHRGVCEFLGFEEQVVIDGSLRQAFPADH